jgi:hypothetical protein
MTVLLVEDEASLQTGIRRTVDGFDKLTALTNGLLQLAQLDGHPARLNGHPLELVDGIDTVQH